MVRIKHETLPYLLKCLSRDVHNSGSLDGDKDNGFFLTVQKTSHEKEN